MDSTEEQVTGVLLRPVTDEDVAAVAEVHRVARWSAVPHMPEPVHPESAVLPWVRSRLAVTDTWVAEVGGDVVGYASVEPGWLDMLYVLPEHARQGIGSALLEVVKALQPGGFGLWVFASNEPARRFYLRHGLVELEHTDGAGNDETAPDLRMVWPGDDPMAYLRGQVDAVDDELAVLLARRAALTACIQQHKTVPGHAGRDPRREAEIAARMATRGRSLPQDTWERLVDAIITASLDTWERVERDG